MGIFQDVFYARLLSKGGEEEGNRYLRTGDLGFVYNKVRKEGGPNGWWCGDGLVIQVLGWALLFPLLR